MVTIADNGSADGTWAAARVLTGELAGVRAAAQITAWVRAPFTAEIVGGVTVYDLTRAR